VRKRYLQGDSELRTDLARAEFDALQIAARELDHIDGISCPAPILVDEQRGELEMDFVDGTQLDKAISNPAYEDPANISEIASKLARAFVALADALPVRELDFSLRNTLVDEGGSLVLIDFTPRFRVDREISESDSLEWAVASLLTSALTFRIRQSSALKRVEGCRLQRIASLVLSEVDDKRGLNLESVRRFSWHFYWRQSRNRGWKRYLWFNTIGRFLFRRYLGLSLSEARIRSDVSAGHAPAGFGNERDR
jgi:hypothetical protein